MIAAQSIDGFIARADRAGTGFCGEADRRFLREALREFDALVMGRKTFETVKEVIVASRSERFLRKILTRHPDRFATLERPGLVEFANATPEAIAAELAARGRKRCALLGGGEIYASFLKAGLVDELWVTVEPRIFGSGTPLAAGDLDVSFRLESAEALGDGAALLKYARR